jgi:DNA (cytosine-5)-methyltransferase 1
MVRRIEHENWVTPTITQSPPNQIIPIVSLFCGPGGMDLGFRREKFVTILAIDDSQAAVDTYNSNDSRNVALKADIRELSDDKIAEIVRKAAGVTPRGIIGGPPCQSFSLGNVRQKKHDPRSKLGQEYARILKALNESFRLDFFVFENVLGLKSPKHNHRYNLIRRALKNAGFNLFEQELDASTFGVPQKRRRFFLVGINRFKFPDVIFQFPGSGNHKSVTVRDVLGDLPPPLFFKRNLRSDEIPFHPNHWAMNPKSQKFLNKDTSTDGRSFKRLAWDKPSWTVAYGHREVHVHPNGTRRLSVLEAMLLQGFPDAYQLYGTLSDQIRQISDAVPPPLAQALARAIRKTLTYDSMQRS